MSTRGCHNRGSLRCQVTGASECQCRWAGPVGGRPCHRAAITTHYFRHGLPARRRSSLDVIPWQPMTPSLVAGRPRPRQAASDEVIDAAYPASVMGKGTLSGRKGKEPRPPRPPPALASAECAHTCALTCPAGLATCYALHLKGNFIST